AKFLLHEAMKAVAEEVVPPGELGDRPWRRIQLDAELRLRDEVARVFGEEAQGPRLPGILRAGLTEPCITPETAQRLAAKTSVPLPDVGKAETSDRWSIVTLYERV